MPPGSDKKLARNHGICRDQEFNFVINYSPGIIAGEELPGTINPTIDPFTQFFAQEFIVDPAERSKDFAKEGYLKSRRHILMLNF